MTNPTPHGQVPEALRLAEYIDDLMDGSMVNYVIDDLEKAADELRRLHAYCQELEAQVIRDCMTHVQNPAEIEHVAGDVSKNGVETNMKQQPAPSAAADPMDWPLPCDVTVGHGTMCKGVSLRTLVMRMKVLYEMATGNNADEVANRTPEENTALADAFRASIAAAPQPTPTAQAAESVPAQVLDSLLNIVINHEARATPAEVRSMAAELATYRAARAPAESVGRDAEDAARWRWIAEYLVGPRTDLDDEIVASETVNELRKLVDAARAAQEGK